LGIAAMTITPSEAVRRAAIERFGLEPNRVAAVPLAANPSFRPAPAKASRPYFLFVGTLEPRKNIARLIEAWRAVRAECPVDLILAGRVRSDFTPPAPEAGLCLAGAVPEHALAGLYSGALACVYPSLYEGFGLPVLEAMQCGTLAITSRDPAIVEVAAGTAIHVDGEDARALAEAMTAVAREPGKFEALRERALARSREFTWRRTARRTREIYDEARRRFGAK
jgi:glycosyltransferase involved in cell wall biosynthesis